MFNQHFSRRVPTQVKWMFILVILPLYMYCGSLILSALFKFIILQFHIQFDYNQLNAYLNLIFDLKTFKIFLISSGSIFPSPTSTKVPEMILTILYKNPFPC